MAIEFGTELDSAGVRFADDYRQIPALPLQIVATGPVGQGATKILAPYGTLVVASSGTEADMLPNMSRAPGLVVRGDGVMTRAMMDAAPDLQLREKPMRFDSALAEVTNQPCSKY
jgi:hypothetical protein